MERIGQKPVVSSTMSSKCRKTVVDAVPKTGQSSPKPVKQSSSDGSIPSYPDPTRYGDWEHAGRCIDF